MSGLRASPGCDWCGPSPLFSRPRCFSRPWPGACPLVLTVCGKRCRACGLPHKTDARSPFPRRLTFLEDRRGPTTNIPSTFSPSPPERTSSVSCSPYPALSSGDDGSMKIFTVLARERGGVLDSTLSACVPCSACDDMMPFMCLYADCLIDSYIAGASDLHSMITLSHLGIVVLRQCRTVNPSNLYMVPLLFWTAGPRVS